MRTVTFRTKIPDGIIKIPAKYSNFGTRGILHKNNNPTLISKEKSAWEMAVKEKHAHR